MKIFAIDPGLVTGFAILDTEDGQYTAWAVDGRGHNKELVTDAVLDHVELEVARSNRGQYRLDVVVEDFVLRQGQAVDITPMHTIGAIDAITEFQNYKYLPAAHKNGNKAYNISKLLKNAGIKLDGDHKTDAMSLALHHWKIIDLPAALKVLQEIKK